MPKNTKIFKKIALLCMALLVLVISWAGLVYPCLITTKQSRLNAVESDIYRIETAQPDRGSAQSKQQV